MIEVLVVEPMKRAEFKMIDENLASMQEIVGGNIEEYMPFEDEVAIVCNEEGKLRGLEANRGIEDKNGVLQEIICGTFFICYAPYESEKFLSLPDNLKRKYEEKFRYPEMFIRGEDGIKRIKLKGRDKEHER